MSKRPVLVGMVGPETEGVIEAFNEWYIEELEFGS